MEVGAGFWTKYIGATNVAQKLLEAPARVFLSTRLMAS